MTGSPTAPEASSDPALERARALLRRPAGRRESAAGRSTEPGYVDLLGGRAVPSTGRAQDLMLSGLVPRIYERWWRPAWGRILKGPLGPSMDAEQRLARELLRLEPAGGATVLDVACGTGNFTRQLAGHVGPDGLVIGLDVSETMLARAVQDTRRSGLANVAYVRGDAGAPLFAEGSFDGVCCFAALHLFPDPMAALDQMHAALRPGGRIALLTSAGRAPGPLRAAEAAFGALSGMRVFGLEELRGALRARGFEALEWELAGVAQIVGARRAA